MNILGISCYYHDSAACLVKDGIVAAAVQEERFDRKKNSPAFPINAVNYCLQACGLTIGDVDYIAFYEKPYLKFSRILTSHIKAYPFSLSSFLKNIPVWLEDRLVVPLVLNKELCFEKEVIFIRHHLSHAASSFLVSPFEHAAILTADGIGEWGTATYGIGKGNKITILKEIRFPDSLGLLYSAVTSYLGFMANQEEGTVMGLASYGEPSYIDKLKEIIKVRPDGSFRMDQSYFGFNKASKMYTSKFIKAFGKERKSGEKIEDRHRDIAASFQKFTEEIVVAMARHIYSETKLDSLCLAGGLFLNCAANNKILEETPFKEIFIQPAAGDSGGALGAACYVYNSIFDNKRSYVMKDAYLGPSYSSSDARRAFSKEQVVFKELNDQELLKYVAYKISENKIIGWVQDRMEIGPRALGNRSIIANPCNPGMKDMLNLKVKNRESFRPYAPAILEERADEFFILKGLSPFMLLAPKVREEKKSVIPAVTHVDGTARVQTVNRNTNQKLWDLIKAFEGITGVPVLINTSFNIKGEPIVCTPEDAIRCFKKTHMDCLVIGNYIAEK